MILCHCMNITDREVNAAIDWMRASDNEAIITPGRIYRALGKSADCGGCMPLILATIRANPNAGVPDLRATPARAARRADKPAPSVAGADALASG